MVSKWLLAFQAAGLLLQSPCNNKPAAFVFFKALFLTGLWLLLEYCTNCIQRYNLSTFSLISSGAFFVKLGNRYSLVIFNGMFVRFCQIVLYRNVNVMT